VFLLLRLQQNYYAKPYLEGGPFRDTGDKILEEETARRGPKVHNRGRKRVLKNHECAAIEAVEDANFFFASSSHCRVAEHIGLANGSERAI
jgi:hypothetical protein